MELKEIMKGVALTLCVVTCFCGACTYINSRLGLPQDHPLEEAAEELLEQHTGLSIDLSPGSDEDAE